MGEISDDIIEGRRCSLCDIYFEDEHGFPVVCENCWDDLDDDEKKYYQKAIFDEI